MNNSLSVMPNAIMDDKPVIEYAINQGQDLSINMDGEAVGALLLVSKREQVRTLVTEFNVSPSPNEEGCSLSKSSKNDSFTTTASSNDNYCCWTKKLPSEKYIIAMTLLLPHSFFVFKQSIHCIDMDLIKAIAKTVLKLKLLTPGFDAAISAVQEIKQMVSLLV